MSSLDQISEGIQKIPDLMILFGPDGIGKSTFASTAPNPIFLDLEKSSRRLSVKRYDKAKTFRDAVSFIDDLTKEKHEFKTLVIDSLSELERLIWDHVCFMEGVGNIEQVGGGFSKGYTVALKPWSEFRSAVTRLQDTKGMNVIMTAHAEVKTFTDPATNSAYDRYQIKLQKHAAAFVREWVDFVGFANFNTHTKGKENAAKHKAYGDGVRILYTERRPAWDAKNRLTLPLQMELDYAKYSEAANASSEIKAAQARENIEVMLKDLQDEAVKKTIREFVVLAKDNVSDLIRIQEKVRSRLQKEGENGIATTGN